MRPRRLVVAVAAAGAVILSAPFLQQLFTAVSAAWGPQSRMLGISATVIPLGIALAAAVARIRDRRVTRYLALSVSVLLGAAYVALDGLSFTECFHFVEYGLLAWLFYRSSMSPSAPGASVEGRALPRRDDGSIIVLPLLAGVIVGTMDEWFQWFIPIRAGEVRDVMLDLVASVCGLLFALSIEPPDRLVVGLHARSRLRVGVCAGAVVVVLALFVFTVHVGHEVLDPRIGSFRARYTTAELVALARDRTQRWAVAPPRVVRRISREDQYLSEGLWHVGQRNLAWEGGDLANAWRENLILETFYAPILDTPTYAELSGHRWPPDQRTDAEERPGIDRSPGVSDTYRYPLFVWPGGP